jgi:hypothetical protein
MHLLDVDALACSFCGMTTDERHYVHHDRVARLFIELASVEAEQLPFGLRHRAVCELCLLGRAELTHASPSLTDLKATFRRSSVDVQVEFLKSLLHTARKHEAV